MNNNYMYFKALTTMVGIITKKREVSEVTHSSRFVFWWCLLDYIIVSFEDVLMIILVNNYKMLKHLTIIVSLCLMFQVFCCIVKHFCGKTMQHNYACGTNKATTQQCNNDYSTNTA